MAKRGQKKGKKRRAVKVQFIEREHTGKVVECYEICERIVKTERADLEKIKIGFAWHTGWRPDADGRRTLGKCAKRKDLDRELDAFDFIILLNKDAWQAMSGEQKERLIFHELEHAQVCVDTNGEPLKDDRGRFVCRLRKHDIEEFRSVVERYGVNEDLSKAVEAAMADAQRPLLAECEKKQAGSGMEETIANEERDFDGEAMREMDSSGMGPKPPKRKKQKKVKDLKK